MGKPALPVHSISVPVLDAATSLEAQIFLAPFALIKPFRDGMLPHMDSEQRSQEDLGSTTPSFARMPRGKPMHIPSDVHVDYESRGEPIWPWGVVDEGFLIRSTRLIRKPTQWPECRSWSPWRYVVGCFRVDRGVGAYGADLCASSARQSGVSRELLYNKGGRVQ